MLRGYFGSLMVFSFFKKPPEKMVARPAAAPRPRAPEAGAPPVEPAAAPAPAAAAAPASAAAPAPDLDTPLEFSDFEFSESPPDFHVEADVDPIDSDVEQAAVLYANGQNAPARAILEDAVRVHNFGPGERLWLMLFDLYRLTGEKAAFESLEIEYARAFEKSPPTWRDRSAAPAAASRPAPAAAGSVAFKGELTGDNAAGFEAAAQALEKATRLRLDLSRVKTIDAGGCSGLLALLQKARKTRRELELLGREHLGALLEPCIQAGHAEAPDCWLLLLELLQLQGQQEAFDEVAINYAVTFEVSPPSWEPKRVAAAEPAPAPAAGPDEEEAGEAYPLHGDIKGARFADLPAFAEQHDFVVIDCAAVTRIDFVSAGALLNALTTVRRSGKQIVFRHPNHLVAELFGVVGLKAVAEVIPARH